MNDTPEALRLETRTAFLGLLSQALLALGLMGLGRWAGAAPFLLAGTLALNFVPIWAYVWLESWREEPPEDGAPAAKAPRGERLLAPLLAFCCGVLLCVAGDKRWSSRLWEDGVQPDQLKVLALAAAMTLLALAVARYFPLLAKTSGLKRLEPPARFLLGSAVLSLVATCWLACVKFGLEGLAGVLALVIPWTGTVLGLEMLLFCGLDFFRPRSPGKASRPAYDSRLLELFFNSRNFGRSFGETFEYQFGFEMSKSWFMRLAASSFLPLLALGLATVVGMSCLFVVETGEEAVVLRFGRLRGEALGPGLHLKAPWPVDLVERFDTAAVRKLHVGSHQTLSSKGEIYLANAPVLWYNQHGLGVEEYLLVAPPPGPDGDVGPSGRAVAASLLGGDIFVEYRISDLLRFLSSASEPERLFAQLAESEASRELLRHDLGSLLGGGRAEAERRLLLRLQEAAKGAGLGIEPLKVGFGGVHPPQAVAESFHETIIARKERESRIEAAKAYVVQMGTAAAGSVRQAEALGAAIAKFEENPSDAVASERCDELMRSSGGWVAEKLAVAQGYRWAKENSERGKAELFARELALFKIGPHMYPRWLYFSLLERGMADKRKLVLLSERKGLLLHLGPGVADLSGQAVPPLEGGEPDGAPAKNNRDEP